MATAARALYALFDLISLTQIVLGHRAWMNGAGPFRLFGRSLAVVGSWAGSTEQQG